MFEKIYMCNIYVKFPHHDRSVNYKLMQQPTKEKWAFAGVLIGFHWLCYYFWQVMCQWVEDLRKELCTFWLNSFPVFFNFMEVIVVGIVGATLIIKVLKVFCPSCDTR